MRRGNCLIFALLMRLALGGRIASEPSKYGWWRHYWWESACGKWRAEYNPPTKRRRLLPPPIFRGSVTLRFRGKVLQDNRSHNVEGADLPVQN